VTNMPDNALVAFRLFLVAAQEKSPMMSQQGQVATYTIKGMPEISFIKVRGDWYFADGKTRK